MNLKAKGFILYLSVFTHLINAADLGKELLEKKEVDLYFYEVEESIGESLEFFSMDDSIIAPFVKYIDRSADGKSLSFFYNKKMKVFKMEDELLGDEKEWISDDGEYLKGVPETYNDLRKRIESFSNYYTKKNFHHIYDMMKMSFFLIKSPEDFENQLKRLNDAFLNLNLVFVIPKMPVKDQNGFTLPLKYFLDQLDRSLIFPMKWANVLFKRSKRFKKKIVKGIYSSGSVGEFTRNKKSLSRIIGDAIKLPTKTIISDLEIWRERVGSVRAKMTTSVQKEALETLLYELFYQSDYIRFSDDVVYSFFDGEIYKDPLLQKKIFFEGWSEDFEGTSFDNTGLVHKIFNRMSDEEIKEKKFTEEVFKEVLSSLAAVF